MILIGGMSYCTYNFSTASQRVKKLCCEIEAGMQHSELIQFALKNGLGPQPKKTGVSYIVESKTFGRWGCKVELENGVVDKVEYTFSE